ncbi:MAG: hypothetical protein M3Y22_16980 [Pseudomonadota bacterium]|nr:hypothetical protein [Pseudomonadota bacterium]
MRKTLILAAVAAFALASAADAKSCKDPTTGKFIKCPVAATAPAATAKAATPVAVPAKGPHCVKGKACGASCIAVTKACHKPT